MSGPLGGRLTAAMPRVVAALRDLVVELDMTNDELIAALTFLTEVGKSDEAILLSDVLGISRLVDDRTHAGESGTASNVLGPFYRFGAPWIDNPGSVVRSPDDGEPLVVGGRVLGAGDGRPIPDAVVDVWQANGQGDYSNETSLVDPWHLRGRQRSAADGSYRIATIRPLHYTVKDDGPVGNLLAALGRHPWRPAHVHFHVSAPGCRTLVTQAYIAGGPYLDDDTIDGVKDDLIVQPRDGVVTFDIRLAPAL